MEHASFPTDLFPLLLSYTQKKYWIYISTCNKEVYNLCKPIIEEARAVFMIKPVVLRLRSCYIARRTFIKRLQEDIAFRKKYLYIHEPRNGPTHICWHRVPPSCLAVRKGLEQLQRLLVDDIELTNNLMMDFNVEQYNWVLNNVRIVDGTLTVRV